MIRRLATLTLMMLLMASPALAQRLAGGLSDIRVRVMSDFIGQDLTLFGNIEPNFFDTTLPDQSAFQIVVVVTGPKQDRTVRKKTDKFLIWLNTESEVFHDVPSFKWVYSSARLDQVTDGATLDAKNILLSSMDGADETPSDANSEAFRTQLVRLMAEKGLYGIRENGVLFVSPTLYSARIELPDIVPSGTFLAKTFLFSDGVLIAQKTESFSVAKAGLEQMLGTAARHNALLYGLACVGLAVLTGLVGSIVFRK